MSAYQITPIGPTGPNGNVGAIGGIGATGPTGPTGASGPIFTPSDVPAIAAGYYWLPRDATGLGTVDFTVPEGNGHAPFNLAQAVVLSQPTQLTENGGVQFRMRKVVNTISTLATAGQVTAGWAGATYFAAWLRLPDASGDITGTTGVFLHANNAQLPRLTCVPGTSGGNDFVTFGASLGVTNSSQRFVNPFTGAAWHFVEQIFDPGLTLGGTTEADYLKSFSDFSLLALSPVAGTSPRTTMIRDDAQNLRIGQSAAAGNLVADTFDWAAFYYGNGIPTLNHRIHVRNHYAPLADDWSLLTP